MIFAQPNEVNAIWSVIARATAKNELGIAAKVGPDDGHDRKPRLICVYTKDFTDIKDVSRVVHKLKDIGVVDRGKAIYYKCGGFMFEIKLTPNINQHHRCVHLLASRL
jgi:hypothetical protein